MQSTKLTPGARQTLCSVSLSSLKFSVKSRQEGLLNSQPHNLGDCLLYGGNAMIKDIGSDVLRLMGFL